MSKTCFYCTCIVKTSWSMTTYDVKDLSYFDLTQVTPDTKFDKTQLYKYFILVRFNTSMLRSPAATAQKMKFSIRDFFSKCVQIRSFLRIWSHLLKKSLMENFISCADNIFMVSCDKT